MYKPLHDLCQRLEAESNQLSVERKMKLHLLRDYLRDKYTKGKPPKVIVICTHNSRRSHIGQLWLTIGADYFNLPKLETFSGGTEATSFHPNAIAAIERIGVHVETSAPNNTNPVYELCWTENRSPYKAFSKKYEDAPNPTKRFAAVMVCSEADAGCPFVKGSEFRLALPYQDPKAFDRTPKESAAYDEKVLEIGREMLYVLKGVAK
ncbi:MAG: hypothetical protein AAF740_06840 [Bacteroidota bacterium]